MSDCTSEYGVKHQVWKGYFIVRIADGDGIQNIDEGRHCESDHDRKDETRLNLRVTNL